MGAWGTGGVGGEGVARELGMCWLVRRNKGQIRPFPYRSIVTYIML